MQHLYTQQSKNMTKTWLLMAAFLAILVALGYFLSVQYQNPSIFTGFIVLSIFMNIVSYWYSDKIVLRLSRAREATRSEFPEFWDITESLAKKAELPMPKLYVIDDQAPNAFATGRDKDHAAVAVTTGLLRILDREELEGVIAHELSHIGNKDILLSTVVAVLVGCISLAADFAMRSSMFRDRDTDSRAGAILMVVGLVFIILSPIAATLIQLAISRKREFIADASAGILTEKPSGLAGALQKISAAAMPLRHAHAATAHMFISNPLKGADHGVSSFAKLFMTHPPTHERVEALLAPNH
jgi:heat shock protein HtpX